MLHLLTPVIVPVHQKTKKKRACYHEAFTVQFYDRIEQIADEWDAIAPKEDVFFTSNFMKSMEEFGPSGMEMRYIIVYRLEQPIGILSCALKRFEASESIQLDPNSNTSWLSRFTDKLKSKVINKVSFNTLICGNILFTGEHAFYFNEDNLSYHDQFNIVEKALQEYQYHLLSEGMELNVSFMKDFYIEKGFESMDIDTSAYNEFKVQPNMILDLKSEWRTFEDYLASFHSKARVRAKKAFKRGTDFERRELSLYELRQSKDLMFELYKNVSEQAGFNLFELKKDYFFGLKKYLKDNFKVYAYYYEGEMIAFYTAVCNKNEFTAHFLGYDKSFIRSHDLYLNILFDLVRNSIAQGCKSLNYGRTAMEIKSSVGALPHDMFCYLKHRKQLNNLFVPHLVSYLNPQEEWKIRSPFKKSE